MKKLIIWLALLLPFIANAQVNGIIQKTASSGTIRGSFGSLGIDTIPRVTGVLVNGYILKYNASTNKWYASPDPTYPGLQDSLTKKANRTFDNVASGAIAKAKADTSANGLQTVSNFFPKGDTRYQRSSVAPTSISATSPIFYNSGTGVISSQAAGASDAGHVTTGSQTFGGTKTFSNIIVSGLSAASVASTATDGVSGVFTNNSASFESLRAANNGSGLIASFRNSGGEVASILNSGGATFNGSVGIGGAASVFKLEVRDALPALFLATSDATTSSYGGVRFARNTKLNGSGNGFQFSFLNSSDATAEYGYFGSIIESNTAGSENGTFIWAPSVSGSRTEKMRLASSGNLTVASLAGTGTRMVVADPSGVLSTQTIPSGSSGTYTPTLTNVANVSSSSADQHKYTRVGNIVTVFGQVSITVTSGSSVTTTLDIALPIASNLASSTDLIGVISAKYSDLVGIPTLVGNITSDLARFEFGANTGGTFIFPYSFSYTIL